ncbi:MAG: sulfurtransferase complex subunit TusB [Chloroflexi bacterium]|jgi:tRNA 2-thiouridine synthesizing protein B|nr:sulfurtransferase complex subunit TusB [Chloroflexota bacterium]
MLYMVNKSPLMFGNLKSVLGIAPAGEPILLYEDGAYAAATGTASEDMIKQALEQHPVYALQADLEARGLTRPVDGIQVIDYDGFVELVEQHHVVPWL